MFTFCSHKSAFHFLVYACLCHLAVSWPVFYLSSPVTESLKGEPTQLCQGEALGQTAGAGKCMMSPVFLGPAAALCPVQERWHWCISLRNWKVTGQGAGWAQQSRRVCLMLSPPGTAPLVSAGDSPGLVAVSKLSCTAHYHNAGGHWWDPEY